MNLVALIHTVPTVYATFGKRILDAISQVRVVNTVDEFLASDPAEKGVFTAVNRSRLFSIVKVAEATGADAIVTTCSTLSPVMEELRPFMDTPLVTIDGAMLRSAVQHGTTIGVLATADSTIGPTTASLELHARRAEREIAITTVLCPAAYVAIKARDQETHDREVLARVDEVADCDVIVLAQASMAHLEEQIAGATGRTVLSSPRLCIDELREVLANR